MYKFYWFRRKHKKHLIKIDLYCVKGGCFPFVEFTKKHKLTNKQWAQLYLFMLKKYRNKNYRRYIKEHVSKIDY